MFGRTNTSRQNNGFFDVGDAENVPSQSSEEIPREVPEEVPEESPESIPRLYANQRGRRAASRDAQDLVAVFAAGNDLLHFLKENHLLEEWFASC